MDAGDGSDLVDLVEEDDSGLRAVHVVVGVLQELPDDGLDVVAHVAGHGERGAVADGERHVQAAGDRLRQKQGTLTLSPQPQLALK